MTKRTLYLFPDTNLFIQCRPLADLDWSEWDEFEEVHLIACRPVQREIDSQKNRGNDRVAQRARTTYGVFLRIIDSESDFELVRPVGPQVRLYLQGPSLPSEELNGTLDYGKADDEIVGCLHKYRQENPNEDARLLTHDGGPMMTAKSLGIPFIPIKDEWLLPPEHNESEKEVARLKDRVAQLEKSEPQFFVQFEDAQASEIVSVDIEYTVYGPLTSDDISSYIFSLKERFPLAHDFGPREPAERQPTGVVRIFAMKEVFTPATDEDIRNYKNKQYPDWLKACEDVLSSLHEILKKEVGQPSFTLMVENRGSRPGIATLVEIEAKGNIMICPPLREDDEESTSHDKQYPKLPLPPRPPRGKWTAQSSSLFALQGVNVPLVRDSLSRLLDSPILGGNTFLPPSLAHNSRRDPNAFYYKPNRPTAPTKLLSLECEQWRHGTGAIYFDGEIVVGTEAGEVRGAIECRVHAENLSTPVRKLVPVRLSVIKANTVERAQCLVQNLLGKER